MHALRREQGKPLLSERSGGRFRLGSDELLKRFSGFLLLALKREDARAMVEAHPGEKATRFLPTHSLEGLERAVQLTFGLSGVTFAFQGRDAEDLTGRCVAQKITEPRQRTIGPAQAKLRFS